MAQMENAASRLWEKFPLKTGHRWLNCLLIFVPLSIVFSVLHLSPLLIFLTTALAIAPMAGVLGESTSSLAAYAGPTTGGLLDASLGNATEFIIALFALHEGHIRVVKASLSGSIIGNLLLVLGLSIVVGVRLSRTWLTLTMGGTAAGLTAALTVLLGGTAWEWRSRFLLVRMWMWRGCAESLRVRTLRPRGGA